MEIKTKFNEGDEIFFISPNKKAVSSILRGYKIEILNGERTIICLCAEDVGAGIHLKVDEKDAYPSKQELLKTHVA